MTKKKKIFIWGGIGLIVVIAVIVILNIDKKEIRYNTTVIHADTVKSIVTATGYVQPVDKVDVGTQVSGVIEKIYVDFNSVVKKGQLIAELDKSTLREKLTQANASLTSALSDMTYAQQNYDRTKQLFDAKAATQAAYEEATNTLAQAKTNVANAKANVHQAQVNLNYAEIYSPIDGVILNRAVEQGQTVAASFSTPTLFTIANDLKKMQVEANVDEADIGQVRLGQKVTFTVDSYIDDTFEGTVQQIRMQPTVTNNVVTYTVIVQAPNPEEKLYPGMTASISVVTQNEEGLTVPAEALNFHPADEMLGKEKRSSSVTPTATAASASPSPSRGVQGAGKGVWAKTAKGLEYRHITTGLSDGVNVIVTEGLHAGDTIVLSASLEKKSTNGKATTNPLMPQRPRRR